MPRGMHPNSRKALEENRHHYNSESAVKAKQKSSERVREKRTFREEFELELAAMISDASGNKVTVKNALTKTAVQKALRGDLRALSFIRDTIGEKPAETVQLLQPDYTELDKLMEAMANDQT